MTGTGLLRSARNDNENLCRYEGAPCRGLFLATATSPSGTRCCDNDAVQIRPVRGIIRIHDGEIDMNVAEILKKKGNRVVTVPETAPVLEAVSRMAYDRIGALVVSRDGRNIEGIITERDVLLALAGNGAGLATMKVEDIMTRYVVSCTSQDDLKHVMSLMAQHRFRHMPVVGEIGL